MKSLAAILVELNQPLVLEELEIPALDVGQVLVKVLCSGICGSQLGEIRGVKGVDRYLPHLLGHEATGIVIDCGAGVTTVSKGDRVVMHWRPGAGIQARPPSYTCDALGTVNAGWITTFNEHAVVSENRLTAIADDVDPEVGALMGCAVTTGLGVINNNARVKIGQSVVVWGAGGVGLNIIQGAAMVSADPVVAIDLYDAKLKMSRKFGATHTINANTEDAAARVIEILGSAGADVAIDNTGNVEVIRKVYDLTKPTGKTILVGVPTLGDDATLHTLPLHFEKTLTGSHGGEALPNEDIPTYLGLYRKNKLQLKELITDRYDLQDINQALDDMRNGQVVGRCMISMEPSA